MNRADEQHESHVAVNQDNDSKFDHILQGESELNLLGPERLDLERLRLPQNFVGMVGGKKGITTVPVRRPDPQTFIRVHPDPGYQLMTAVLEMKEDREVYLVDQPLWNELAAELVQKRIVTAITRQGNLFLWAPRVVGPDGRLDAWNASAHQIVEKAITVWVRVLSNKQVGAYEYIVPGQAYPEPEWPPLSFAEILDIAFRGRFIKSADHPIVKRLRGEL